MLLNKQQENPVRFEGRNIDISDKVCNGLYMLCETPVTESTIGMYVSVYTDGDKKKKLSLTDKEIAKIVEEGVKVEYTLLCGDEAWDKIPE